MTQPINQVVVNEATRLVARFDTFIEDMQRGVGIMLLECDGAQARLSGRATVKCEKCRVDVDVSKLNSPGRCADRTCPLKKEVA